MTKIDSNGVEVRDAVKGDIASIHGLIAELADFENLQHQFVATVEDLENGLSGEGRAAEALVAELGETIIGYAIFFPSYSTFIGKAGLWLEDLYVQPDFRGNGVGQSLILALAKLAEQRGCQSAAVGLDVTPVLNGGDDGRIGAWPADALVFQRPDQ